jgi:hypothetical protein
MKIRDLAVAIAVLAFVAACDSQPTAITLTDEVPVSLSTSPSVLNKQLAAIRAATARYHDVAVALAEGFEPISPCVFHPQLGGMGFHYARLDRMEDADYVPTEPEMLLYVPGPGGRLKLVGVEYWIAEAAWNAAERSGTPLFLGRPFDYTPAGHRPANYSLHVWVWQPNPSGVFAPFNPRVSCS